MVLGFTSVNIIPDFRNKYSNTAYFSDVDAPGRSAVAQSVLQLIDHFQRNPDWLITGSFIIRNTAVERFSISILKNTIVWIQRIKIPDSTNKSPSSFHYDSVLEEEETESKVIIKSWHVERLMAQLGNNKTDTQSFKIAIVLCM